MSGQNAGICRNEIRYLGLEAKNFAPRAVSVQENALFTCYLHSHSHQFIITEKTVLIWY